MTAQENEAVAHRWHMDLFQAGKLEAADEILASNFIAHVNGQEVPGVEGARQLATAIRSAFSDIRITHHDAIVAGDRVAIRWTVDGTHSGDYMGVAPTGRHIRIEGIELFHLRDGKLAEAWIDFDNVPVLQQMGAAPVPVGV